MNVQQVRTALKKLEQTGEISVIATNEGRRIKCCHYTVYQAPDFDEQQASNRQATDEQQASNRRATPNNNNKNNNHKKNDKKRLQRKCSFDIEELKRRALYDDDYDI